ncbi:MAG: RHS repeat protein [Elusimicrobia bacterium]|nr:RHS repeat protein [Elusimicrobiota bacterium]
MGLVRNGGWNKGWSPVFRPELFKNYLAANGENLVERLGSYGLTRADITGIKGATYDINGRSESTPGIVVNLAWDKEGTLIKNEANPATTTNLQFDGLNRPILQTRTTTEGQVNRETTSLIAYGADGRVATQTNRVTETGAINRAYSQEVSYTYDAQGRAVGQTTRTYQDTSAPLKNSYTQWTATKFNDQGQAEDFETKSWDNTSVEKSVEKTTGAKYDNAGNVVWADGKETFREVEDENATAARTLLYTDRNVGTTYDLNGRMTRTDSTRYWGAALAALAGGQKYEQTYDGGGVQGLSEDWTSGQAQMTTTYGYDAGSGLLSSMKVTADGTGVHANGEVQAMGIHLTYHQSAIRYDSVGRVTGYHQSVTQVEHYEYVKQTQKGLKRKNSKKSATESVTTETDVQVLEYDGFGRQVHTITTSQRNDRNKVWTQTDTRVKSFDDQGRALDVERKTQSKATVEKGGHGLAKSLAKAFNSIPLLNVVLVVMPVMAAFVASGSLGGQAIHSYSHTVSQNQYTANGTLDEEATKAKTTTLEERSYQQGLNYGDKVMQAVDVSVAVLAVVGAVVLAIIPGTQALAAACIAVAVGTYQTLRRGISTHDLGMFGQNKDRGEARQNAMSFYSATAGAVVAGAGAWMAGTGTLSTTVNGVTTLTGGGRFLLMGMQVGGQMAAASAGGADGKTLWTVGALSTITGLMSGGVGLADSGGTMTATQGALTIAGSLVSTLGLTYGDQKQGTTWLTLGSVLTGAGNGGQGAAASALKTYGVQMYSKSNDGSGGMDQDRLNRGLVTQAVAELAGGAVALGENKYRAVQEARAAWALGLSVEEYRKALPTPKMTVKTFMKGLLEGLASPIRALAGLGMNLRDPVTLADSRAGRISQVDAIGISADDDLSDIFVDYDTESAFPGMRSFGTDIGGFESSLYSTGLADFLSPIDLDYIPGVGALSGTRLLGPSRVGTPEAFQSVVSLDASQKQFDILATEFDSQKQGLELTLKKQADTGTALIDKQAFHDMAMSEIDQRLTEMNKTGLVNAIKDGNVSEMLNSIPGVEDLKSLISGRIANLDVGTVAKAPLKALELLLGPAGTEMDRAGQLATLYVLKDLMTSFNGRIGKEKAALEREGKAVKAAEVSFKAAEAAFGELKTLFTQGAWTEKLQNRFNALVGAIRVNQIHGQMDLLRVRIINGSVDFEQRLEGLRFTDSEKQIIRNGISSLQSGPYGALGIKKAASELLAAGNLATTEAWGKVESLMARASDLFDQVGGMQKAFDLGERISDVKVSTALLIGGVSKHLDGFWARMAGLGMGDLPKAAQVVKDTLLGGKFGKEWVSGHIDFLDGRLKTEQMVGEVMGLTAELALTWGVGSVMLRSAKVATAAANIASKTGIMAKGLSKSLEALSALGNRQVFLKTARNLGGFGGLLSVGIEQFKAAVSGQEIFKGVDMLGRTVTTKERGWIGWSKAGSVFVQGAKGGLGFVKWTPLAEAAAVMTAGKLPKTLTYRAERGAANYAAKVEKVAVDAKRGLTFAEKARITATQQGAATLSLTEGMLMGMGADHTTAWAVEKGAKAVGLNSMTAESLGRSAGSFVGGVSMGMVSRYRGRDMELAQDFVKGKFEAGKTYSVNIHSAEALALFKKAAGKYEKTWIKNRVEFKPNVDPELLAAMKPADVAKYGKWLNKTEASNVKAEFAAREKILLNDRIELDLLVGTKKAISARYEKAAEAVGNVKAQKENVLAVKELELAKLKQDLVLIEQTRGGESGGVLQTTVRQKGGWFTSLGERIGRFFGRVPSANPGRNAGIPEGIAGGSGTGRRGNQEIAGPAKGLRPGEGLLRGDGTTAQGNGAGLPAFIEEIGRVVGGKQSLREEVRLRGEEVRLRGIEIVGIKKQISRFESIRSGLLEKAGGFKARSEDFRRASVDVEKKRVALRENRLALDSAVTKRSPSKKSAVEMTARAIPDRPVYEPTGLLARAGILWDKATLRKTGNYELLPATADSPATLFVVAAEKTPLSAFSRLGKALQSDYVVAIRLSNKVGAKPEITLFDVATHAEGRPIMTLRQVAMGGKEVSAGGVQFNDYRDAVRLLSSHAAINGKPVLSRTSFFEKIRDVAPSLSVEVQGYIAAEIKSTIKRDLKNSIRQWLVGDDDPQKSGFLFKTQGKREGVLSNQRGAILTEGVSFKQALRNFKESFFGKKDTVPPAAPTDGPPLGRTFAPNGVTPTGKISPEAPGTPPAFISRYYQGANTQVFSKGQHGGDSIVKVSLESPVGQNGLIAAGEGIARYKLANNLAKPNDASMSPAVLNAEGRRVAQEIMNSAERVNSFVKDGNGNTMVEFWAEDIQTGMLFSKTGQFQEFVGRIDKAFDPTRAGPSEITFRVGEVLPDDRRAVDVPDTPPILDFGARDSRAPKDSSSGKENPTGPSKGSVVVGGMVIAMATLMGDGNVQSGEGPVVVPPVPVQTTQINISPVADEDHDVDSQRGIWMRTGARVKGSFTAVTSRVGTIWNETKALAGQTADRAMATARHAAARTVKAEIALKNDIIDAANGAVSWATNITQSAALNAKAYVVDYPNDARVVGDFMGESASAVYDAVIMTFGGRVNEEPIPGFDRIVDPLSKKALSARDGMEFYSARVPDRPENPPSAIFEMRHSFRVIPGFGITPSAPSIRMEKGESASQVVLMFNGEPAEFESALKKSNALDLYIHGYNVGSKKSLDMRSQFVKGLKAIGHRRMNVGVSWSGDLGNNPLSSVAFFARAKASADMSSDGLWQLMGLARTYNHDIQINATTHSLGARVILDQAAKGMKFNSVVLFVPAINDHDITPGGKYEKAIRNIEHLTVVYSRRQEVVFGLSYFATQFDYALGYTGPSGVVRHPDFKAIDATDAWRNPYGIGINNHGDIYEDKTVDMLRRQLRLGRKP